MDVSRLISHLESYIDGKITHFAPVSGGDINLAFSIKSAGNKYFIKYNHFRHGAYMLETEAEGLLALEETATIPITRVIAQDSYEDYNFLILVWIETGQKTQSGWISFGRNLARLHKNNYPAFGFHKNNFIGSLAQSNNWHDSWINFYSRERILPQIKLAFEKGLLSKQDISNADLLCSKLSAYCPAEAPALTHGDLWGGNFIFNSENEAVLIDPSVSYAHREMDLAMSKLFGGFQAGFYNAYNESFPLEEDFENRMEIYQLYYLLVHLNLFGSSYADSCKYILKKFA